MDLNKKLEELKPYQLNCNVFDVYSYNGLTMQDLLCQFFTKINECITVSNETIDLAKWLVNEGLEIEVVKKLMIWLEDGTLENLINVNLFKSLNDKINGFSSQLEQKVPEVIVTDFTTWQECHDYCLENKKIMRIPKGEHILNEPLHVKGVTIVGDGANNTTIILNNCDGFVLEPYNTQKPVSISNLSMVSRSSNMYDLCGICFQKRDDGLRSRGYKLHDLYFENLGCAIELTDCFRVGLNRININNCYRALLIKGQVVQLTGSDITSNCDISDNHVSTRYGDLKIGIEIKGSTHSGEYLRPESIKFNTTSMVNHDINVKINDVLYCSMLQCDFDLSRKQCILTSAYDGMLLIADSWISTKSSTSEPVIEIHNADNLYKKLVIRNNNISVLVGGNEDKVGIGIGVGSQNYFKKGVEINGNTIKSFTPIKLKYGVYADRIKSPIIINNHIQESTEYDIYCPFLEGGQIDNNYCSKIKIISNDDESYSCRSNTGVITTEGTAIKNIDFYGQRVSSEVVVRNQTLNANETLSVVHNFNLTFDKILVELYTIADNEFYQPTGISIKYYDKNSINIINKDSHAKAIYLKISKV